MAIITLNGLPMHTIGTLPDVGTQAPPFTLTRTDLAEIHLKNYLGSKIILNIFPSLDTPTCASAMRHFNEIATKISDVLILCISADLPFAQKRFCSAEQLDNVQAVSVFRHPEFGTDYGVMITDGPLAGLMSRAALALDEEHRIIYQEQVKELTSEPHYENLIAAING